MSHVKDQVCGITTMRSFQVRHIYSLLVCSSFFDIPLFLCVIVYHLFIF